MSIECESRTIDRGVQMPVARYFLWVGSVLLALLFIADAYLPKLPERKAIEKPAPIIRIYSGRKWPERIVFDTSAPMPRVAIAASTVKVDPVQQPTAVIPDRARQALAQLQAPDGTQMQAKKPKKQEAQRQQEIVKRHVARSSHKAARQSQYAWFSDRTWW